MAPIAAMIVSVRTRLNVIPKRGLANAQRDGRGHIATSRVRWGRLARTVFISVLANSAMLRGLVISRRGNVFASLVTQEISMLN